MTEEQRGFAREYGMLILGLALGILGSVISGLWSAYYVEWYKSIVPNPNWIFTVIMTSILLIAVMVFLFAWSINKIRVKVTKTKIQSEKGTQKLTVKNGDKELEVIGMDAETVDKILQSWKKNSSPDPEQKPNDKIKT